MPAAGGIQALSLARRLPAVVGAKAHVDVEDAQLDVRTPRGSLARAEPGYRVALVTLRWVCGTIESPNAP